MNTNLHFEILEAQEKTANNPTLFMLHGYGSHEKDLFGFADALNKTMNIVSFRAPRPLAFGGFCWYEIDFDKLGGKMSNTEQAEESLGIVLEDIKTIVASLNSTSLNLMGFSQGCILSYGLMLNNPGLFNAVIGLSGYVLKDIVPGQYKANSFNDTKLFISHGTEDEVLPVEWARQTHKMFEQLEISHTYREYPQGHGINPDNYRDLLNWMKTSNLI